MNTRTRILIAALAVGLALAAGWFALEWRSEEPLGRYPLHCALERVSGRMTTARRKSLHCTHLCVSKGSTLRTGNPFAIRRLP